jgi:hypothetical protein
MTPRLGPPVGGWQPDGSPFDSRLDISKGPALREEGNVYRFQHNRTRPPPGGQCYRGRSQPKKEIALLAEGVSASKQTYKHSTPSGCSLTEVRCFLPTSLVSEGASVMVAPSSTCSSIDAAKHYLNPVRRKTP